jgi:hypothetical protein
MAAGGEPSFDRAMFLFTDDQGAVVLIEDDLARVLGLESPDEVVGDPLGAALGLDPSVAEALLRDVVANGFARPRLAEIWSRRTRRRVWVLLGATAPKTGGGYIGADVTVAPVTLTPPDEDLDHRFNLERMAVMVQQRMHNGDGPAIAEEKEIELRSYFAARMLAMYVLIVRMAGNAPAQSFESRIRQVCREKAWEIDVHRGRMIFGGANVPAEAWRTTGRVAVDYAVQVTSKRLVARELAELDVNFASATIQRATRDGLRGEV